MIRVFSRDRRGFAICAAWLLLSGCGATNATQTSPLGASILRRTSQDLIYVTGYVSGYEVVNAYTLSGDLVAALPHLGANGLCSDSKGDVYVPDGEAIYEYAHAGTKPIAKLNAPGDSYSCAVDPSTGNLAVTLDSPTSGTTGVAVYQNASGAPQTYAVTDLKAYFYCGYDDNGNLFVNGSKELRGNAYLAELPSGGSALSTISLNKTIKRPGAVQWDGQYLAVGDSYSHVINRVSINGSRGKVVAVVKPDDSGVGHVTFQFWIDGDQIMFPYKPHHGSPTLGFWPYPAGGSPVTSFTLKAALPSGVTLSAGSSR